MDVGYRKKEGVELRVGRVSLLVWVKKKLPESEVKSKELLPKYIDGVAVDVLDEGEEASVYFLTMINVLALCVSLK